MYANSHIRQPTNSRIAWALFVFFFALYALTSSGNAFRVPDEFEVYFQAEHLADAGDISVPQTLSIEENGQPIFFGEIGRDGRPYAPYGPAIAYLILPFHALGRLIARLASVPRVPLSGGIAWSFLVGGITTLASAFAAAAAVAGFYRAASALGAGAQRARLLSLLLGGATMLWVYGTTLYSEAWLAAAFIWAAALLMEARQREGLGARVRVAAAAVLLAVAGLVKPTGLVIAPGFVVAALADRRVRPRDRWETALVLACGIALAAGVHLWWNVERFGAPMDFGYNLAGMIPRLPARSFALEDIGRGLLILLLTPGKAMLLWAPPLLLSIVAMRDAWGRERALVLALVIATAAALLLYGAYLYPEGGYAHGPRHLVPLVPLWLLPAALATRLRTGLVALCAAAGVLVCALAVSVSFFEDQSPVGPAPGTGPYYARIDPAPGRAWNRYRLDYVPFVTALGSGRWLDPRRPVGNGPDFFVVHLARARRLFPGGRAIPAALPWVLAGASALLLAIGIRMGRPYRL